MGVGWSATESDVILGSVTERKLAVVPRFDGKWKIFIGLSLLISDKSEIMLRMAGSRLDEMIRALANETRRSILARVWNQEAAAGEIAAQIDLAQASVSEHLKVLRKAGLVRVQKSGTSWLYRADQSSIRELHALLEFQFPLKKDS